MKKDIYKNYRKGILEKFDNETSKDLRLSMSDPTLANIRNRLLEIIAQTELAEKDETIILAFFPDKKNDSILKLIKDNINLYKAVQNFFLDREIESDRLILMDLAALLIDYEPRPFFLESNTEKEDTNDVTKTEVENINTAKSKKNPNKYNASDIKQTNIFSAFNFSKAKGFIGKMRQLNFFGFRNKQEIDNESD